MHRAGHDETPIEYIGLTAGSKSVTRGKSTTSEPAKKLCDTNKHGRGSKGPESDHTMAQAQQVSKRIDYLTRLVAGGFHDVHVIRKSTAEQVLTEKRLELLEEISEGGVSSVRELARQVDRDVSIVSRDLKILSEADVVEFEDHGNSKRPQLAHENILIEPIVFDGQFTQSLE